MESRAAEPVKLLNKVPILCRKTFPSKNSYKSRFRRTLCYLCFLRNGVLTFSLFIVVSEECRQTTRPLDNSSRTTRPRSSDSVGGELFGVNCPGGRELRTSILTKRKILLKRGSTREQQRLRVEE